MATQPWRDEFSASVKAWSDHLAALTVDALIDGGVVGSDNLEKAKAIVSEEIFVRLCLLDYPPIEKPNE